MDDNLKNLLGAIVPALLPEAVYLFGSRAHGRERPDSDYDLLVVVPDNTPAERMHPEWTYRLARKAKVPADIVTCRRKAFNAWRDQVGTLSFEASHNGTVVYGA